MSQAKSPMSYGALHDRIAKHLQQLLDARGRKSRGELMEALGVGSTFLYDLNRQKGRLPMDKITQLLGLMEIPPADFFYEALREEDMPELRLKKLLGSGQHKRRTVDPEVDEDVAEILRIVEERMRGGGL